jgi:hypothetical protein
MRVQRSTGLYNNSTNQVLGECLEYLVLFRILGYILFHSFDIKRLAGYSWKTTLCYLILSGKRIFKSLRLLSSRANEGIEIIHGFSVA